MNGNVHVNTGKFALDVTYAEALIGIGVVAVIIIALLLTGAFVLDKLNVKSWSFKKGFTFYEDGEERKKRFTARRKTGAKTKTIRRRREQ